MAAFLLAHWRLVLALALTAVLGLYITVLRHEVSASRQAVAAAQQQIGSLTVQRDGAAASAKACSDGVAKLQQEAEDRARNAQAALQAAQARAAKGEAEASRLRRLEHSGAPPGSICPAGDAVAKVREGL